MRNANNALYAGGFLILLGFLAGSAFGISEGQASLGAMIGVGAGALLALVLWLVNRGRT
jgi:hypothetical protein